MYKSIVIGTAGHAAEIQEYIMAVNASNKAAPLEITGFLDDDPTAYKRYDFAAPYLGSIQQHKVDPDHPYLIGIANPKYRRMIVERFLRQGAKFLTVVHPAAYVSPSAVIGKGCILGPYVNIGPMVIVGNYNLLNARCSLGHDTELGDFNFISPNVSFSGGTKIGNDNLFGINAATVPGITIGNRNKVEAGMVLDRSVGDDAIVFFRYKERVIARPKE